MEWVQYIQLNKSYQCEREKIVGRPGRGMEVRCYLLLVDTTTAKYVYIYIYDDDDDGDNADDNADDNEVNNFDAVGR